MTTVRKIDFGDLPEGDRHFSAHRDTHWLEKAVNPRHPLSLRVYFVALGRRRVGGHAPLDPGELAELLVSTDAELPDRRRIAAAIKQCVAWGYLDEGSNALCLVVPRDDVRGGNGAEHKCRRSHRTRTVQPHRAECECPRCSKVSVKDRTPASQVSTPDVDTVGDGVRSAADTLSVRPLLSSSSRSARTDNASTQAEAS